MDKIEIDRDCEWCEYFRGRGMNYCPECLKIFNRTL